MKGRLRNLLTAIFLLQISLLIGVKDNIKGLIPSPRPETFIGMDDTLIILGSEEQLKKMLQHYTA